MLEEPPVAGPSSSSSSAVLVSEQPPELPCFQQALFTQEKFLSPAPPRKPTELMAFHIFQLAKSIGLYALGLYNSLHPSWQSRTYSRHVTWVSQQVFEIGLPAAFVLYHSWRNHLNAAELAAVAFQLSRERDRTVRCYVVQRHRPRCPFTGSLLVL
ncbi:unnamed protein product [Dibothriocephalus latus]|uniref:Uncharacterized protein n=1 Tax=Dibothriocephalus latus TaxID=60516 RepID=A0A3P7MDF0_DIBLA|nr:unnamed protein product [Dibothriocephalus latus]